MRCFLPLVASELCGDLPVRELVTPSTGATSAEEREWFEYEAAVAASLISLELVRDLEEPTQRRIVVALEGDPVWENVEAILVDGLEAEPLVRRACAARTQEEADEVVEELLDALLEWFDVSERVQLCQALNSHN
ncbi:DUF6912 family protein [Gleimia europaea]|uniref:Uncharacterized protein n=1 Tax=Gleimia europaea ACS-120-V-Col10b TaxID=883069 RepID=A0A9W5REB9_9ACTO|nr:hypothetical protein HMPREF9238_00552 [Gleimia europaea ACS-120-V-Col10b]